MDWIVHDSQDAFYRSPFGAVPCGSRVRLRLMVHSKETVDSANVRLWKEGSEINLEMRPIQHKEGMRVYEAEFEASAEPGLLWYYFYVVRGNSVYYYGNNHQRLGGKGVIQEQPPPSYQVTVYSAGFTVPAWFKETVLYQIYVDRFFNGREDGRVLNPRKGSLIHGSWDDTPLYVRDPGDHGIRRWTFFGGNLEGVIKKLPYLQDLGIGALYLNPIFDSPSNHKYDTGDYLNIDPMYGDNETFRLLCEKAKEYGIRVILDGVFSHTGSDSIYFNKEGNYPGLGAYQSKESPYYRWFRFIEYPHTYESWWGIDTLPNVEEMEPSYQEFIIDGENSVVKYWMKMGAAGWRLDVADELPDKFIKKLRRTMKRLDPESVLIGEVWEDASNKVSYGHSRAFLWGEELDSVMNYPFRRHLLDFILGKKDALQFHRQMMSLYENYPREAFFASMNLVGSHDVARILTLLGEGAPGEHLGEIEKEKARLSPQKKALGLARLRLVSAIQMTFPGVPCLYYGDEAGMEGYADPYNRGPYPWGREEQGLLEWYRKIIALRNNHQALKAGDWFLLAAEGDVYGYLRQKGSERIAVFVNRNVKDEAAVLADMNRWGEGAWQDLLDQHGKLVVEKSRTEVRLSPLEAKIFLKND
ncbi:MAG: glycoside hydrolase family 13 protein [Peptococcaceae bacterium]|jgi:4-alpha-glucanotransferase|nr:glycoside hydrolase family 13 protein [Peptococcaceae bacterium]MDH7524697.1 glycoside hydrolase family 13 protein [Peptococcaceae bacterium]